MAFEKKYMKVLKNIFPSKTNPEIQKGNIKDLIYFCNTSPEQLQHIGPYLCKKAKKNIKKKRYNYVKACIFIMCELVVRIRNILIFSPAIKLMELLLNQSNNPELQIEATKTFAQFVSVQNDTNQFPQELFGFIRVFVDMTKNNSLDNIQKRQIKTEGLKGIAAYISLLNLIDELDSFISINTSIQNQNQNQINSHNHNQSNQNNATTTTASSTDNIIFILLDNMQYTDSIQAQQQQLQAQQAQLQSQQSLSSTTTTSTTATEETDSSLPADVRGQATECLKDLSRRVENVTVGTLVNSICNYLDIQGKWSATQFSSECLKAVAESIKPQHYSILLTKYLNHLESPHATAVTIQIVQSSISVVKSDTTVNLIITSLLKVLVRSIEVSNSPQPDVDEQVRLQSVIIETLSDIAKKLKTTRSKVEIMNHIMNFLRDVQASYSTKQYVVIEQHKNIQNNQQQIHGMNIIILDLVQCIYQVSNTLVEINPAKQLNDITVKLLDLSNNELTSPESRIYIQKILHSFLLPANKSFDALISNQGIIFTTNDGVEEYLLENSSILRDSIFSNFVKSSNQPNNIISLFKTIVLMLFRGRNKEIQYSVPMLFQLQTKSTTLPFRLSRSINIAIASYFLLIPRLYKSNQDSDTINEYINEILKKREISNQSCRYLGYDPQCGLVIVNNKHKYNHEKDATTSTTPNITSSTEDLSIDQSNMAEILSNISSLTSEFPDIRNQLLSNKFSKSSLKDLQLSQDENTLSNIPKDNNIVATSSSNSTINTANAQMNRSNTIPVLAKSVNSESSSSTSPIVKSQQTQPPVESSNNVTFESFKKFTNEPIVDEKNAYQTAAIAANNAANNNPRSLNNLLVSKDLSYEYVSHKVEEVQQVNSEYNQLLNILEFTETSRQNLLKQQHLLKQQQDSEHNHNFININSISNTNNILNHDINPNELSSSCTLKMNIQNVLERVF